MIMVENLVIGIIHIKPNLEMNNPFSSGCMIISVASMIMFEAGATQLAGAVGQSEHSSDIKSKGWHNV